jgi:acyl dehydratase
VPGSYLPPTGSTTRVALRFSQADFDQFARLSGDDNPIHVDPVYAAGTRFGRPVAHGMLLFAAAQAALHRWVDGPLTLHEQELLFPGPTYAGDNLTLELTVGDAEAPDRRRIALTLHGPAGDTCRGTAICGFDPLDAGRPITPNVDRAAERLGELRLGQRAERVRTLGPADVADLIELVDDPHPHYRDDHPLAPPALLGGMISDLLGVTLPGPGTNWLKQHYRFHRPVPAGTKVRASVEIIRLRPEKHLVDLSTVCETEQGVALTGRALVLVGGASASL